jgi:restriction endonuclease S subunit
MKDYSEYKDSNVEWIGKIPAHWEMRKVSRSFNLIGSGTTPKSNQLEYYENGTISWVITGDLNDGLLKSSSKKITQKAFDDHSTLKLYPPGTLIIAMYGATIGKISILGFEGCTNQACCAIAESPFINTKFAFYWFLANKRHVISMGYGGGQPNISQDIIRSLRISSPPLPEQQAIADFLDRKTTQIDELIAKKQRQIDLLHEQRTALINQAVTKGLNPDVPMKDSGVEWLGEIPSHWDVKKLKYVTRKINDGTHITPTYVDEGIPFLRVTDIQTDEIDLENVKRIPESEHNELYKRCNPEKGDLLLSKNGTIGITKVVDWDYPFSIFVSLCLIKFTEQIDPYFFSYFFQSDIVNEQIFSSGKTTSVTNLHLDKIRELIIIVPSKTEQQKLINWLDIETKKISDLVDLTSKQIDLLQEYRTALISAAVTGKIDVRGEAVHE